MLKIYILVNKSKNNQIELVSFQKKKVIDWANRYLCHHTSNKLVCYVWNWGKEVDSFTIKVF